MAVKYRCNECGDYCEDKELLVATNPFDGEEMIYGCPQCKCVNEMVRVCDHAGCRDDATCGMPTEKVYKHLCGFHYWQESDKKDINNKRNKKGTS